MIDVQTRPIFLEGPGETFNWIFCGLYLYVSISQLLKNSLWLGLKLLRGRSLTTLTKFCPLLTTYLLQSNFTTKSMIKLTRASLDLNPTCQILDIGEDIPLLVLSTRKNLHRVDISSTST